MIRIVFAILLLLLHSLSTEGLAGNPIPKRNFAPWTKSGPQNIPKPEVEKDSNSAINSDNALLKSTTGNDNDIKSEDLPNINNAIDIDKVQEVDELDVSKIETDVFPNSASDAVQDQLEDKVSVYAVAEETDLELTSQDSSNYPFELIAGDENDNKAGDFSGFNEITQDSGIPDYFTNAISESSNESLNNFDDVVINQDTSTISIEEPSQDLRDELPVMKHSVDFSQDFEQNFSDDNAECVSEGSISDKILKSQSDIMNEVIAEASNEKVVNFEDDSTLCTSEGGNWNVIASNIPNFVANLPSTVKSGIGGNFLGKFDIGSVSSKKLDLLMKLLSIGNDALGLGQLCDLLDDKQSKWDWLDIWLIKSRRSFALTTMLSENRAYYIKAVSFYGSRIPRDELPNVQGVPYPNYASTPSKDSNTVPDCELPNVTYKESLLDKMLLSIFRKLVQQEINFKSSTKGIRGLLEEGRHFMLSEEGTPENQHQFVRKTLAGLLTPFLPPFYRIFMAGIVPSENNGDPEWLVSATNAIRSKLPESIQASLAPGKQHGPWFYAPFLTSVVTPPFMNFLLGPSQPNLRKDGQLGGMVVKKCKFLQESGCKGLCLHQCKLPAQQFFAETLGVPLTVSPNFVTQECQWSWGEKPLPVDRDPDFPRGCLAGCESRLEIRQSELIDKATICNA